MQVHHIQLGVTLIVHHQDNTATNCSSYGVLITQSYPASLGTPGTGVTISVSNFVISKTDVDWMFLIGHQLQPGNNRHQRQE